MGKWLTYEGRLEYQRKYNAQYSKDHPDKIKIYSITKRINKLKREEEEEAYAKSSHRLTILVDEEDEGFLI